ncbi:MAG: response regulator transcription factor [Actinobacteria bacterium]|nr:response regulator transcription factor [Actinomycetota bacterium]
MVRIVVIDDHPIVREGLVTVLSDEPDFEIVGEHDTAEHAMSALAVEKPDVVVIDYRLPGISGIDACRSFRERDGRCRVVVLTSFPRDATVTEAFTAGAHGFLVKESEPAVMREAVRCVAAGGTFIDPKIAGRLVSHAMAGRRTRGPFGLSSQERRVLEYLPSGATNAQIGLQLGIAEETVKSHLRKALRKLEVSDRKEAVDVIRRKGLV